MRWRAIAAVSLIVNSVLAVALLTLAGRGASIVIRSWVLSDYPGVADDRRRARHRYITLRCR